MNKYLLHGKLSAKHGHRDQLAAILLEASQLIASANGCRLYAVSTDGNENHAVYVTEIWDTKEDHDQALNTEGVRELIMKAVPILEGQPSKGQELSILGGKGV